MNASLSPASVLFVAAAPSEATAIAEALGGLRPDRDWSPIEVSLRGDEGGARVCVVRSGVGKVNAALCTARCLEVAGPFALVVSLGIGGALPACGDEPAAALLDVVIASRSVYADEGSQNEAEFVDIAAAGFPPGGSTESGRAFEGVGIECAPWSAWALERLGAQARVGPIATVSTCSGTDQLASAIAVRTGAIVEGMEGAGVGHAVRRVGGARVGFLEIRVVSNTTGHRSRQVWKVRESLERLGEVARRLIEPT